VLQCVAVCCIKASVISGLTHSNAVCNVSQRAEGVSVCCSVLQGFKVCCGVLHCAALCCRVCQCAALCCRLLQSFSELLCVAVCCSVLQ